jgi:hypothetical protein
MLFIFASRVFSAFFLPRFLVKASQDEVPDYRHPPFEVKKKIPLPAKFSDPRMSGPRSRMEMIMPSPSGRLPQAD